MGSGSAAGQLLLIASSDALKAGHSSQSLKQHEASAAIRSRTRQLLLDRVQIATSHHITVHHTNSAGLHSHSFGRLHWSFHTTSSVCRHIHRILTPLRSPPLVVDCSLALIATYVLCFISSCLPAVCPLLRHVSVVRCRCAEMTPQAAAADLSLSRSLPDARAERQAVPALQGLHRHIAHLQPYTGLQGAILGGQRAALSWPGWRRSRSSGVCTCRRTASSRSTRCVPAARSCPHSTPALTSSPHCPPPGRWLERLPRLHTLSLPSNRLASVRRAARCADHPTLAVLDLQHNRLGRSKWTARGGPGAAECGQRSSSSLLCRA